MEIKKILHYPRLDSVLMVEKLIYDTSGTYTKKQLWDRLPKKMMYQTFSVIIDYLLYSGKIAADIEGKICWIWNPEGVEKYLKKKHLFFGDQMKSEIAFVDEKLEEDFQNIHDEKLKNCLKRAFEHLKEDAFCGIQIPKHLIPKEYEKRYGLLTNLWKYNLPDAWRLVYTIKNSRVMVLSVILEWMDHKTYERRFKY